MDHLNVVVTWLSGLHHWIAPIETILTIYKSLLSAQWMFRYQPFIISHTASRQVFCILRLNQGPAPLVQLMKVVQLFKSYKNHIHSKPGDMFRDIGIAHWDQVISGLSVIVLPKDHHQCWLVIWCHKFVSQKMSPVTSVTDVTLVTDCDRHDKCHLRCQRYQPSLISSRQTQ